MSPPSHSEVLGMFLRYLVCWSGSGAHFLYAAPRGDQCTSAYRRRLSHASGRRPRGDSHNPSDPPVVSGGAQVRVPWWAATTSSPRVYEERLSFWVSQQVHHARMPLQALLLQFQRSTLLSSLSIIINPIMFCSCSTFKLVVLSNC